MQTETQNGAQPETATMPTPVTLTEKAAAMVQEAMKQENLSGHGLRVGVMGGGCSGLQYLLDFAEKANDDDFVSTQHGVQIFVDPFSAGHLEGTTVDYVDDLNGSGFKFNNPNAVRACGCGNSFAS